jgi:hypothetical protein
MKKHIPTIDVGQDAGVSPAANSGIFSAFQPVSCDGRTWAWVAAARIGFVLGGIRRGLKPQPINIPGFAPFWLWESMSVGDAR